MFLDVIVIVLRETLEASVLIAVLLSIAKSQCLAQGWLFVALLAGLFGAIIYGVSMGEISEWFDYTGQELINAGLQGAVYFFIALLILYQWVGVSQRHSLLPKLLVIVVATAFVREGAELYVFYSGFLQKEGVLVKALSSGFIGLAVGLSVGAIVYYSLAMMTSVRARWVHTSMLALIGAGMVLQATQLLIQADWITVGSPLWNSSSLLAESSLMGQVAYAIFGYEATPSVIEISVYGAALVLLAASAVLGAKIADSESLS